MAEPEGDWQDQAGPDIDDLFTSRQTLAVRQLCDACQLSGIDITEDINDQMQLAVVNNHLATVRWMCDIFDTLPVADIVQQAVLICELDITAYLIEKYQIKITEWDVVYRDAVMLGGISTDKRICMLEWLLSQGCSLSNIDIAEIAYVCDDLQIVQWFVDQCTMTPHALRHCVLLSCQQQDNNIEALKCFVSKHRMSTADLRICISKSCIVGYLNNAEYLYTSCGLAISDLERVRENIEQSDSEHKQLALDWVAQKTATQTSS